MFFEQCVLPFRNMCPNKFILFRIINLNMCKLISNNILNMFRNMYLNSFRNIILNILNMFRNKLLNILHMFGPVFLNKTRTKLKMWRLKYTKLERDDQHNHHQYCSDLASRLQLSHENLCSDFGFLYWKN